jgi:hypothetical protein
VGELRRHVLVFVAPSDDLVEGLVQFAKQVLGLGLESTMNLPLTRKVKIDTEEGTT